MPAVYVKEGSKEKAAEQFKTAIEIVVNER